MAIKPGIRDLLWMASGAAVFLAIALVVLHFHPEPSPAEQVVARARKLELVDQMRVALASASDSEQSAVLAVTDEASQAFADESHAALATLDQRRAELAGLLGAPADPSDLLGELDRSLGALRQLDGELMGLAVKNTNLKAYALAYGPAADASRALETALDGLAAAVAGPDAPQVQSLASKAQISALRLQTLLPPHIAEESGVKMDQMEAAMTELAAEVQRDLDGLQALPGLADGAGLRAAGAAWTQFLGLKTQVVALSRENTNVRSLSISLDRRRKVVLACQAALDSLRGTVAAEPIAGVTFGQPAKPR